jgi:ATP-dependent Clp protease ATP-binding subunit ClpC
MTELFDRFGDEARRVFTFATEDATQFHNNYIGSEHLLLGMARDPDSAAGRILLNLHAEPDRIYSRIEALMGFGAVPTAIVALSPRVREIIRLAIREADRRGHPSIGSAHLLLGLIQADSGIGLGILGELDVSPLDIRPAAETALDRISESGPSPSS